MLKRVKSATLNTNSSHTATTRFIRDSGIFTFALMKLLQVCVYYCLNLDMQLDKIIVLYT